MKRVWHTVRNTASRAAGALLDLVYPPHCAACSAPLETHPSRIPGICDACLSQVKLLDAATCSRCAHPLGPFTADLAGTKCPECSTLRLAFRRTWAACEYDGPVQKLVRMYKYGPRPVIHRTLAALLARRLEIAFGRAGVAGPVSLPDDVMAAAETQPAARPAAVPLPHLIVPVPLHPRRRRERGFDQAELLAEPIARRLGVPLALGNLVRVRHTTEQAGKSRAARMRDLAGAFAVRRREAIAGRTVLLIDDVMTTASTADACARALRAMDEPAGTRGADEVWVAVAARVR